MPASRGSPLRVLICYGGIALAYLVGPAHVTQTPAYKPALRLARHFAFGIYPIRLWGGLLLVITAGLVVSLHQNRPVALWHWAAAMSMFWAFWVVQFTAAVFMTGGGWAAPFYALVPAWYAFERATPSRPRKR